MWFVSLKRKPENIGRMYINLELCPYIWWGDNSNCTKINSLFSKSQNLTCLVQWTSPFDKGKSIDLFIQKKSHHNAFLAILMSQAFTSPALYSKITHFRTILTLKPNATQMNHHSSSHQWCFCLCPSVMAYFFGQLDNDFVISDS